MKKISRREFIRVSTLAAAGAAAAACAPQPTPTPPPPKAEPTAAPKPQATTAPAQPTTAPAQPTAAPKAAAKYREAPMLTQLVQAGKLPPVDQRLPENPKIVEGLDGIGKYGGLWRMSYSGQADQTAVNQVKNRGLLKINEKLVVTPGMAESWEVSPDGSEFTFKLRKGLKWSDGKPLTSADFVYWYENVIKHPTLTKAIPTWLTSLVEGKRVPLTLTAPDAFTIKYKFAKPKSLFYLDGNIVNGLGTAQPAHYMKQWHMDLADDKAKVEAATKAGNYASWDLMYAEKNLERFNNERPTNEPWLHVNSFKEEIVRLERNPYFWCVDKEGNQLPYIDRLQFRLFQDPQVHYLRVTNGEIDCQGRHSGFSQYTIFKENEKKGDYTVQMWKQTAVFSIHFNMTAKNPKLRELFQARDFRIAVSLGVNRDELNQLLYEGLATPMQYGPPKGSPQYYEKLNNAYLEYNPKKANELLDALGYNKRDSEGYRLWKDGSGPVSWTLLGGVTQGEDSLAIIDYLKKLGFKVSYKGVERSLSIQMHNANDVECTLSNADRTLVPLADPQVWIKHTNIDDRPWCNAWTAWYIDPKHPIAEEPPKGHWIWTIWDLYDQIMQASDDNKRNELFRKILDIWAVELPSVGFLGDLPKPIPVKNGLKGIKPGNLWDCCSTSYEHIIDNSTWYWDDPEKHK